MKRGFCLSCYAPNAYVFSVPLRASAAWLKRVLRRKHLINAVPLRKTQFDQLKRRVQAPAEVGWHSPLEYFLEGYRVGRATKAVQPAAGARPRKSRSSG